MGNINLISLGLVLLACCLISTNAQLRLNDLLDGTSEHRFGDQRWWIKDRIRYQNRYSHPTHIILASKTVRPSTIYRCVVSILYLEHPVDVRAALQRDGVEIASAKKEVLKGSPETLLLQVPKTVADGVFELNIEGNVPGTTGGTIFFNSTNLHFSMRFLTILIQTNRPIYTGDQHVRFRIILLTTDLRPYDDPVDIYVLDSDGYVMRRWPSRPTNVGVISMSFKLPFLPKSGWWTLRAVVNGQIEEKKFKVEKWYTPLFETKVFMPKFFLETNIGVTGTVIGEYLTDKKVFGDCTLKLYARNRGSTQWNYIMQERIYPFEGEHKFFFSMHDISRRSPRLDGSEIKVEAEVMDVFKRLNHTGLSYSKIINSTINCRFIGSPPFVFKPGMPFHGTVAVSYHDLQPLEPRKLKRSKLVIRADAGGAADIPVIVVPHLSEERRRSKDLESAIDKRKQELHYKTYYGYDPPTDYYDYPDYTFDTSFRYLSEDELVAARVSLLLNRTQYDEYRERGYFEFKFDVPRGATSLTLTANYNDDDGDTAGAQAEVLRYYSSRNQLTNTEDYLSIETSTKRASVGEFVVFNVRASFKMFHFEYLIMAKDLILFAARETMDGSNQAALKTISVPVSSEMAPSFTVIVYHMTSIEVIADSLTVPVDSISRHKVSLDLNKDKDHTLDTVEVGTFSSAGAFFGISGMRHYTYAMQGGNELTHSSVLEALHSFTNQTRPIHRMTWRAREGLVADQTKYFVTGNYGPDANRTFLFNGLVTISDAPIGVLPGYRDFYCNETEGYLNCLIAGCYRIEAQCDGIENCADGYDELGCQDPLADQQLDFRIGQFSRFQELYDPISGDWMWLDTNIGHKGYEVNTIKLPRVDDEYIVNGFSMSQEYGFGLIEAPLHFMSLPPIYISLEMPDTCRRGETVGLRTLVYNTTPRQHMILLIVHGSDQHRIVKVGPNGVVDYYSPELEAGDHQHLVTVNPYEHLEVVFPVAPLLDHGLIVLNVSAISQIGRDERSVNLTIQPEGATIDRHTSILLDLKNRALVYEYMDIIIDESYEIPLEILRRFVAGSPRGHISLCGDVVGPSFPNNKPVDTEQMLRKVLRGTEASTFNFGANLWTLHYLRLINQLDFSKHFPIFEHLNVELAAIMYRFDAEGAFRMWDTAEPSVWLSAWTTRILQHAQFQDWENYIYIEPSIISKAVTWLLKYQTPDGSFYEHPSYQEIPLDQKMYSQSQKFGNSIYSAQNISLTAHVLITLEQTIDSMQGEVRSSANSARFKAMSYIEKSLPLLTDPYEIAICAYALSLTNSVEKEAAYGILNSIRREENGLIYWSKKKISTNARVRENNQRSLLQPKFEQEYDSHAVEATSYALLVYLIREGVTIDQNRIVDWLNAMRMHDGGFISTVDTLVAMQALTEYSYRARIRDITNMFIEIEVTGESGRKPHQVHISKDAVSELHKLPIENVWGMVTVVGRGAGQAILQLDVSYGVDWYGVRKMPPKNAFDMRVKEHFSVFGNKSIGEIEICARWTNLKEAAHSSATVIEVENPTGYMVHQLEAEETIRKAQQGSFPSIRDVIGGHADFFSTKTVWFFDFIPGNTTWCFEYKIRRWYPVANMTDVRMATIYEQYQPERFQMYMFNSSTRSLDVCEVCASYQCPYCPIYSHAAPHGVSWMGLCYSLVLALISGSFLLY